MNLSHITRDELRAFLGDICIDESENTVSTPTGTLTCHLCGRTTDPDTAINKEEWEPSFWHEDDAQTHGPVCNTCRESRLEYDDEHGDFVLPSANAPNV